MTLLNDRLNKELESLDAAAMRRRLRSLPGSGRRVEIDGRSLLNFAGNDYLALAQHPALQQAAIQAIQQHGVGSGASRLVTGHLDIHERVEQAFAELKHAPAAMLFPTGYMANLGVLTALPRAEDLICQDKLNHASLIDAARASAADVRTFGHLDHDKLERLLDKHHRESPKAQRFIVTDSVFSMDGDTANLPRLCGLAERYDAVLVVDEAHGTGVLGKHGAGLIEAQGVEGRVPIVISTASKALGGLGGIVTADRVVIDTLINRARPLIYTTAVPPAQAAAIGAALQVVRDEPDRRERLSELSRHLRERLHQQGWADCGPQEHPTPIVPLIVGDVKRAVSLQNHLLDQGVLAVAIRPPTVPPGTARVRLSLRSDMTDQDTAHLLRAVAGWSPTA